MEMWRYLGFEPWRHESPGVRLEGVSRKITLVKSGLLGTIAKYYAWDYIAWLYRDPAETVGYLMREWKPLPDVVTQRFVLVGEPPAGVPPAKRRARSFWMGLMGFLEIYTYLPGGERHARIEDLVPPIDRAWTEGGEGRTG